MQFALLAVLLALTWQPAARAFTLLDAVQAARAHDRTIAAARLDQQAAHESYTQGVAGWLPRLSLDASHTVETAQQSAYQRRGNDTVNQASINLRQPILDMTRVAQLRKGSALSALGDATLNVAEQKLLAEVAHAYLNVLVKRENLETLTHSRDQLAQRLAVVKAEVTLGISSRIDADEAQAAFDEAVAERLESENALDDARSDLDRMTGLDSHTVRARFNTLSEHDVALPPLTELQDLAILQPMLRQKMVEVDVAEQTVQERRGQFMPKLELSARHQYSDRRSSYGPFAERQGHGNMIGLNLSIPLYSGGERRSQLREARYQAQSRHEQLVAAQRAVSNAVAKHYMSANSGLNRIRASQQRVASAQRKLESTTLGKSVGLRSNLDILKAEQEYTEARQKLAQAFHDYHLARLELAFESGQLDWSVLQALQTTLTETS